jgi:hypothetical protein
MLSNVRSPIHVWDGYTDGEPRYLCGIALHDVLAGIGSDHLDNFPEDMICPQCLDRISSAGGRANF